MSTGAATDATEASGARAIEAGSGGVPQDGVSKLSAPRRFHDIAPRIASGVALAVFGVGATLAGGPWIAAATAAAVVAMSFEWARMSEPGAVQHAFAFLGLAGFVAVALASLGAPIWALGALAAFAALSALRRRDWAGRLETAFGIFYVGAPCALFVWTRGLEGGLEIILFLFAVIWSADIFAYLGGVGIGGPKLHPALSPQKTWSGIGAGVLAGAVGAGAYAAATAAPSLALPMAAGAVLAAIGLGGDLFESFLKRRFGVKDASGLIPGHGGVMDRIDGLMAAVTATALALALWPDGTRVFLGLAP